MRIFLKNEPGIFGIFENMSIGIFKKNEPGIFGNFEENYSKKKYNKRN